MEELSWKYILFLIFIMALMVLLAKYVFAQPVVCRTYAQYLYEHLTPEPFRRFIYGR